MQNIMQTITQNKKLVTISFVGLIILITIIFLGISVISGQPGSSKQAESYGEELKTNLDPTIENDIQQNNDSGDYTTISYEVASSNEWKAVQEVSTSPDDFGNSWVSILKKTESGWEVIGCGSDCSLSTLEELGIPKSTAEKFMRALDSQGTAFAEGVNNSKENPRNKYPILQQLPYRSPTYDITYRFDDNKEAPTILIEDAITPQRREYALERIAKMGYDPADYNIVFTNLSNPFTGGQR